MERPFRERRGRLAEALAEASGPVHVTRRRRTGTSPGSGSRRSRARDSTASSPSRSTAPTSRTSATMFKIKHDRTADCVVAGFRWHKKQY